MPPGNEKARRGENMRDILEESIVPAIVSIISALITIAVAKLSGIV